MCCRRVRRQRDSEHEIDPARASRDEFHPKGRKGGGVVRIQTDDTRGGRLPRYSPALIDTQTTGIDGGRVLGDDNAHEYHHRHCAGKVEIVEFDSYESIEKRFEGEVRAYLESRKG